MFGLNQPAKKQIMCLCRIIGLHGAQPVFLQREMSSRKVYISAGSNMGDRLANLRNALKACEKKLGDVVSCSSVYETAAWGITDQEDFYNIVFALNTRKNSAEVLKLLLETEIEMGRVRDMKWGPRKIDLDILFFDDQIVEQPGLHIPHPEIENRRFILEPMNEIAPNHVHPAALKTIKTLLEECKDELSVKRVGKMVLDS